MHVNKLSLLLSPTLRRMELRNELFRCYLLAHRVKSDSVLERFISSLSSSVPNTNTIYTGSKLKKINSSCKHFSRYSASTIMRPHTKVFSFNDYDVIGFDLDGTVLRYNLSEMVPLGYELLSRYLVEYKNYSKQLLCHLHNFTDIDFLQKGLILDADRGNILKLSCNGSILKANHGTKAMTFEEIEAVYGEERQWPVTMQFIEDPMCAWNGPLSSKMRSLLDYFDVSASLVFARAVDDEDMRRQTNGKQGLPYTVWPDILEALICIYTRENFANGKSEYFDKLKNEPDRYLLKTNPNIIEWLKELRASNKVIFLLTGSYIDFANFTSSYAIGENWRDLFDAVICFAKKPGFFNSKTPFHKIEGVSEAHPIINTDELKMNSVYSMGNWEQLLELFGKKIGKNPCAIRSLYVGDNLIQDVYAPSALANIDTLAICEEMLAESSTDHDYDQNKFEFKDVVASNYWNSYFFENGDPTLWTDIITKYSRMCIPTLEHVAAMPIDHKYCVNNEQGFFPSAPVSHFN